MSDPVGLIIVGIAVIIVGLVVWLGDKGDS
jgi:hypothetical protein